MADNHTFVNALPWMCRTGAPWRDLPERHGKWVTVYRRFNRWPGDGAMEHLLMDRAHEGDPTRPPAESFGLTPVALPKRNRTAPWDCDREAHKGRNMVERVFNRMKRYRKAATRYDRLDEAFLADLWPILIATYLKKTAKNPTSVNTP